MSILFGIAVSLTSRFFRFTAIIAVFIVSLSPQLAMAQAAPSAAKMFENFSDASKIMMDLTVAVSFVVGLFVSALGLLKFKEYAESGGRVKVSTPIGLIVVGALMVLMPAAISISTETLSLGANTGKSLLSQNTGKSDAAAAMAGAMTGILLFVKLIGHIAFFRGLLILKSLSEGAQGATVGRALTHIFGGAAAININATAAMLAATFQIPLLI